MQSSSLQFDAPMCYLFASSFWPCCLGFLCISSHRTRCYKPSCKLWNVVDLKRQTDASEVNLLLVLITRLECQMLVAWHLWRRQSYQWGRLSDLIYTHILYFQFQRIMVVVAWNKDHHIKVGFHQTKKSRICNWWPWWKMKR